MTGVLEKDQYGYFNYEGQPKPTLLNWFPDMNAGTDQRQSQGPWSVTGNADYVVYGGEFTTVNFKAQQGLVRFARTGCRAQHRWAAAAERRLRAHRDLLRPRRTA